MMDNWQLKVILTVNLIVLLTWFVIVYFLIHTNSSKVNNNITKDYKVKLNLDIDTCLIIMNEKLDKIIANQKEEKK